MISVSRDFDLLVRSTECNRDFVPVSDLEIWFDMPNNIMLAEDENVGIATYEYEGLYSVHWYFKVRGREAIDLGKKMCAEMFLKHEAKALRGLIKTKLKASKWACRQLGFKSMGIATFADGDENEIFIATKDEFLKGLDNG